eukprot:CAMPEP_0177767356 /NCGR_PEP_ID=MMETSP0491_2-20121128/9055_1 /TAXON_ID=63592 /ORGANISM="Tetraselmis chuii, Strain PLY429" /LENGTH=616 /DNA_ID=CAMNT_0019283913 /DNA_START=651 /DNA_END=2501 /DNA_ORIENTATION=-
MDPLFSFSDHVIDVSNGVVSSDFLEAASSDGMCGGPCFTAIQSSTSCKYDPLFQKVASICCSNELNPECTELYQTMADLADPTDPVKFPTVARVLVALDATEPNQERIFELGETSIESVQDLMFAPFLELCGKINPDELSTSVASCTEQCSALSNADGQEEATRLAGMCSTVNSNACINETLRVCMPSYRAVDLLGFGVSVSGGFASDEGVSEGGRRRLLEYQGAQYFFTAPANLVLAVLGGADSNGEVELNDDLKALEGALCSERCGELLASCSAASSIPGINDLFGMLQAVRADGLCVEPTPTPTPPPPTTPPAVSSPPPPVTSSPPSPSSTPSTPEDQYFLSRASLSLSLSLAEFDDAIRSTLTSDLSQATSDEPVSVDILGVEATDGGVVAHVAVVFEGEEGSLQSRLNDQGVYSSTVGFQSLSSFVREEGTTLAAVNSRIVELKAQYTTTPPPTPTTTTPAPSSPSGQQFRVVQIEATLPLLTEGDFTDALREQFIADLERLPGVTSARIIQVQGSEVKSAVIVAGESAADATAQLQSLTSALSSSSENFATELGDVTAAVESFESLDSLAAANERMTQLVAEGDSDGDDSAGIRLTASLALLIPALFALF